VQQGSGPSVSGTHSIESASHSASALSDSVASSTDVKTSSNTTESVVSTSGLDEELANSTIAHLINPYQQRQQQENDQLLEDFDDYYDPDVSVDQQGLNAYDVSAYVTDDDEPDHYDHDEYQGIVVLPVIIPSFFFHIFPWQNLLGLSHHC
jgi:hypothetical protein